MVSIRIAQVSAVSVITITAVAGLIAPASAAQAPPMRAGYAVARSTTAKPNSNIVGAGKLVKYSPTSLSAKWSGAKKATCTVAKESFTISNTAKTAETVTLSGKTFAKVPAGKGLGVCAFGSGTATGVFGLAANKKAKLTVHIS
jgi:hypothetical protein